MIPVFLLLFTFALRIWALDARPLWWDEGLTLTFSRLGPKAYTELAVTTEDVNPPLYRWTTGAFTTLAGTTIFTTRLPGVFANLLAAAAFYKLTRLSFGRRAGNWGLLLYAVAPMQLYYAQEAKGYAFESAAIMIGLLLWVRLHRWAFQGDGAKVERAPWSTWIGYTLIVTLALGSNYLAILALVVENIFSLVLTLRARRAGAQWPPLLKHWSRWLAVQLMGALLLLPLPLATLGSTSAGLANTSSDQVTLGFFAYLGSFLNVFAAGQLPGEKAGLVLTSLFFGLALAGFLVQKSPHRRLAAWFTLAWLLLPLIMGYVFQLRYPWFFPRFLLFAQPALLALAGAGVAALLAYLLKEVSPWLRLVGPLATAILLVLLVSPLLRDHYAAPARFEEDEAWPVLLGKMGSLIRDEDLVITRLPWMPGYLDVYLPSASTPDWVLGFFDEQKLDAQLAPLLVEYDRLWEIDYLVNPFQPPVETIRWLRGRAALIYSEHLAPGTVSLLVDVEALGPDRPGEPAISRFENGIQLRWVPGEYTAAPGDVLGTSLTWWTDRPLESRLVRFLHLMTPDGRLVAQVDREPVMGYAPTFEWLPGQEISDPVALLVPPDVPPGDYELWVGLYDRDTVERIPLDNDADHLVIGQVNVSG